MVLHRRRRLRGPLHGGHAVLLSVALALAAGSSPAAAQLRVETVVGGLEVPWALAWASANVLFVTERPGRLRVVHDGRLAPEPVATLPVAATGEAGLMGLAVDPDFARNGQLYVCYTASADSGLVNRVAQLTLRDGRTGEPRVILDNMRGAPIHDGCRLKFGPDGKLYVTMGDAAQPTLAQRRDSLNGKILRINPDGSVPADNPFAGSPIYSLGHRNPQGLAWDPRGRLLEAEHGPSAHDEINRIEAGRNYGWPDVRGVASDPRFVDPVLESEQDTWAPSGIAFLGDSLWVAALRGQRLLRVQLDENSKVVHVRVLLRGMHGRLRDVVVGPDGALWIATNNRDGRGTAREGDDRIIRVIP
jgi:aldose sugar dehydrogenase